MNNMTQYTNQSRCPDFPKEGATGACDARANADNWSFLALELAISAHKDCREWTVDDFRGRWTDRLPGAIEKVNVGTWEQCRDECRKRSSKGCSHFKYYPDPNKKDDWPEGYELSDDDRERTGKHTGECELALGMKYRRTPPEDTQVLGMLGPKTCLPLPFACKVGK